MQEQDATAYEPVRRVLIVDDETGAWAASMRTLLQAHADAAGIRVEIDLAGQLDGALQKLMTRHYHLVSLDILLPGVGGELSVKAGIDVALKASRGGALLSKLIAYSGLLNQSSEEARPEQSVNANVLDLDRYAKSWYGGGHDSNGVEPLNQGQWAQRVLDYVRRGEREWRVDGRGGSVETAIGSWLRNAPKHLPVLMVRHAYAMRDTWDDAYAVPRRIDAALRFIELTWRLALAQTQVLLNEGGMHRKALRLPEDARIGSCLALIQVLVEEHRTDLERWSWLGYLMSAMKTFDAVPLPPSEERHSLAARGAKAMWAKLAPVLQAAMDLASYWALHPIWTELRNTGDGWTGERLAGNAWPRPRHALAAEVDFPIESACAGAWQTAVRVLDSVPPSVKYVSWNTLLEHDVASGSWCLRGYTELCGNQVQVQLLNLESGQFQGRMERP